MFNVASPCGPHSCQRIQIERRVSGVDTAFLGPRTDCASTQRFLNLSAWASEDVVNMSVLLFSFNSTLEKNVLIFKRRRPPCSSGGTTVELLAASFAAELLSKIGQGSRA